MSYMERSRDPYGRRKLYTQHFSVPHDDDEAPSYLANSLDPCSGLVFKEIGTDRPLFVVPLCLNFMSWLDVMQASEQLRDSYEPYNHRHMWNTPAQ